MIRFLDWLFHIHPARFEQDAPTVADDAITGAREARHQMDTHTRQRRREVAIVRQEQQAIRKQIKSGDPITRIIRGHHP